MKRGRTLAKRKYRTYTRKKSIPIQLRNHVFIRKMPRKTIDLSNTNVFNSYTGLQQIKLSDLMDVAEFANLFNQYKIHKVKLTFAWMLTNASNNAGSYDVSMGQLAGPQVNIIKNRYDLDHATVQTQFQENSQNTEMRLKPFGKKTYSFKPNILAEAYRTSTSTGYSPKYDTWLNMDDREVPHYGLDIGIDKLNAYQGHITLDVEVCFSARGVE